MLREALARSLEKVKEEMNPVPVPQAVAPAQAVVSNPNGPTQKQIDFFNALLSGKQMTDEQRERMVSAKAIMTRSSISSSIQWMVSLPWIPRAPNPVNGPAVVQHSQTVKIEEGSYAITHPLDNTLHFYEVRKPTEGKWAGFVFLSELSGENHIPMRDRGPRETVYAEIAKDVVGALKLYGQKIGRCGHCNKQLTDEVSREFGIGPVCRKGLGV